MLSKIYSSYLIMYSFMSVSSREVVTETPVSTPVEDLVAILSVLPQQLTVEDISDFVSLAQYYAARTPQSFRKVGSQNKYKLTQVQLMFRIIIVHCLEVVVVYHQSVLVYYVFQYIYRKSLILFH